MRPVVTDNGQIVATLEAQLGEPAGDCADPVGNAAPGPGLPDAQILLAHGNLVAAHLGMMEQQARERIQRLGSRIRHIVSSVITDTPIAGAPPVLFMPTSF